MKTQTLNTSDLFYPKVDPKLRLIALWYFLILLIVWNLLGHTVLGFEQSWITPFAGAGTAMAVQFILEWVDARAKNRTPRYAGGLANLIHLLIPAFIPGLACGMLLYANERVWPVAFAAALTIGSKVMFRAPIGGGRTQHFMNPSNFGIAMTLLLFPEVGFAPPYHFTENLTGLWDWILPVLLLLTGIIIHWFFTGRMPVVVAWVVGFIIQALARAWYFDTPLYVPLTPMTSAAFVLFALYMIPDPATTPLKPGRQAVFGLSVAAVYGLMQVLHLVFGLFFSLVIVCAIRGISQYIHHAFSAIEIPQGETAPAPLPAGLAPVAS
jgi:Na+-translocating ferredoxin:NAD+ oxidoreductase RnfD subunit